MFYEVLVGNIGQVWNSHSHDDSGTYEVALTYFTDYVNMSKKNIGRSAGEDVSIWADGDIITEYTGTLTTSLD
jgi:hypothetical protein